MDLTWDIPDIRTRHVDGNSSQKPTLNVRPAGIPKGQHLCRNPPRARQDDQPRPQVETAQGPKRQDQGVIGPSNQRRNQSQTSTDLERKRIRSIAPTSLCSYSVL